MNLLKFFAIVTMICCTNSQNKLHAQSNDTYFIQFRVIGLSDNNQAISIDSVMRSKTYISVSRTDYLTESYFAILQNGVNINQNEFISLFQSMGFEISCIYTGRQYIDRLRSPHTFKNCENE